MLSGSLRACSRVSTGALPSSREKEGLRTDKAGLKAMIWPISK
jgi:hypothetical protein